ncbi:MAG: hypothetical protein ACTSRP_26345 [Candidatus Helarchaeota archaeon]
MIEIHYRCLMLKTIMLSNNYRSLIAKLKLDKELAKIIEFDPDRIPSTSILKSFSMILILLL